MVGVVGNGRGIRQKVTFLNVCYYYELAICFSACGVRITNAAWKRIKSPPIVAISI